VDGREITYFGTVVNYDHKFMVEVGGALTVSLGLDDDSRLDDFQRENIFGLVMTPEGRFLVYNVRLGLEFERPILIGKCPRPVTSRGGTGLPHRAPVGHHWSFNRRDVTVFECPVHAGSVPSSYRNGV
jgi:hypothetical protein